MSGRNPKHAEASLDERIREAEIALEELYLAKMIDELGRATPAVDPDCREVRPDTLNAALRYILRERALGRSARQTFEYLRANFPMREWELGYESGCTCFRLCGIASVSNVGPEAGLALWVNRARAELSRIGRERGRSK